MPGPTNKRLFFLDCVEEFCRQRGLRLTRLAQDWVLLIEGEGRRIKLMSYDLGLNDSATHRIVNDKYATFEVLRASDVPVLRHEIVVHPSLAAYTSQEDAFETALRYFDGFGDDVVLKPLSESGGKGVSRAVTKLEFEAQMLALLIDYHAFCITPFTPIDMEIRFYFLEERLVFQYAKRGGGDFRANLNTGASVELTDFGEAGPRAREIAVRAWEALGLRFGCIDVAVPLDGEAPFVMEANSGVMLNEISKWVDGDDALTALRGIYLEALDLRFSEASSGD